VGLIHREGERVIKINFRCKGLPTADPTWAAGIHLLLNPKLLWCQFFCSVGREAQSMYVMSRVQSPTSHPSNFSTPVLQKKSTRLSVRVIVICSDHKFYAGTLIKVLVARQHCLSLYCTRLLLLSRIFFIRLWNFYPLSPHKSMLKLFFYLI